MFAPTSVSATAWMEPPVACAVATALSPSAGFPIASERAIVFGRTGVTGDGLKTPGPVEARFEPVGIDADADAVLERLGVLT